LCRGSNGFFFGVSTTFRSPASAVGNIGTLVAAVVAFYFAEQK
jgi:hypothetical protein